MVFEHVRDAKQAYKNIHSLLEPGGICLNFNPILFSPPFVANYLFPETMSAKLLQLIDASRAENSYPKFPACYNRCRISIRFVSELTGIGFRKVWQIPFFHHNYFGKIPVVRELDSMLSRIAEQRRWDFFASYCCTYAIK